MNPDIIALQEALAHQDELIRQLSEEVYRQQRDIAALKVQLTQTTQQVKNLQENEPEGREPPPPHY